MKNSRQKSIRLNNETIKKVQKLANRENRTFNNMVETILIRELDKCNIADVVGRSEQLVCDIEKGTRCKDSFPDYKNGKCRMCGGQAN